MVAATTPIQLGLSEAPPVPYAGIATRGVALAIDLAIVHAVVLVAAGLLGLVASFVELRPDWLVVTLAAVGWSLSATVYFVLFWSVTGQTPGLRAMRLRVVAGDARPPPLGRAEKKQAAKAHAKEYRRAHRGGRRQRGGPDKKGDK